MVIIIMILIIKWNRCIYYLFIVLFVKKGYKFNLFFVLIERLIIYEECDVDM